MHPRLPALALALVLAASASFAQPRHPLDPLTAEEIDAVRGLLVAHELADEAARYALIRLAEPTKERVMGFVLGQTLPRAAFVVQRFKNRTYEGVVDLVDGLIVDWREVDDARAALLEEEVEALTQIAVADARVEEALILRGLDHLDAVRCRPVPTAGTDPAQRLVRVACWDGTSLLNVLSRPIAGVEAVIDLEQRRVARVDLSDPLPLTTADHTYDADTMATRPALEPVVRAAGSNIRLDGRQVRWQGWGFHVRAEAGRGPIISLVHHWDRGKRRSVLYRGSLAEILVRDQDPRDNWDELRAGVSGARLTPLVPGRDVPASAVLVDAVVVDDRGRPRTVAGALALFERDAGEPAWRHGAESRPAVELVARSALALGTWDYLVDWVFTQDGRIRAVASVTGLLRTVPVRTVRMREPTSADDTVHGRLVAGNLVAPNVEHWLSLRLDLDVDGTANTFVRDELGLEDGVWTVTPRTARRESEAKLDHDPSRDALWRVVRTERTTDVGNRTSWAVVPLTPPAPVTASADDFTAHHLWVTAFRDGEFLAEGLPGRTAADRPLEKTDLVVWATLGWRHVPRLEDFPVTSPMSMAVELRPFNFFERNPAIDLRPELGRPR